MKLFKSLLIAPAAFGLMAPIAVNADTAFSPTSKLGSSVNFTIGSNTDSADGDELHSTYEMKFKSTTSFTGEDKLVGKFEIGNGKTLGGGIDPQSSKGGGTTPTLIFKIDFGRPLSLTSDWLQIELQIASAIRGWFPDLRCSWFRKPGKAEQTFRELEKIRIS